MTADGAGEATAADIGHATRTGVVWTTISFIGTRALTFVATLVLARMLAPSQFGVVAAITVYISFLELISDLGMAAVVVYEQQEGVTERVQVAFTMNVVISVVLAGVAVALAPAVAGFFHMADQAWLFRLASISLVLTGLGNIHDSLLLRGLSFRRRLAPNLARAVIRTVVSVALAIAGAGASALVVGWLAGSAAWMLIQFTLTPMRPTFAFDRAIARSMIAYGSGAAALELVAVIASRIDIVVIGRVLGERVLGLYSIAFRVPELLIENVAWNVSIVAFPAFSRRRVMDEQGLGAMTLTVLRLQALYALPLATGMAILSRPLIVTLFGERWRPAAGVLAAVAFVAAAGAITYPVGDVFKAVGRQRLLVALNLVSLPVYVAGVIVVAPHGILAVAWVRVVSRTLFLLATVVAANRIVSVTSRQAAVAVAPAVVASAGVAIGAGAVRLLWPTDGLGPLLAGTVAGTALSVAALRLGAPHAFGDVLRMFQRRRPAPSTPI